MAISRKIYYFLTWFFFRGSSHSPNYLKPLSDDPKGLKTLPYKYKGVEHGKFAPGATISFKSPAQWKSAVRSTFLWSTLQRNNKGTALGPKNDKKPKDSIILDSVEGKNRVSSIIPFTFQLEKKKVGQGWFFSFWYHCAL